MTTTHPAPRISALHDTAATIERNHFKYKSLSSWSLNLYMGCGHGCPFCFVPETSTIKQGALLRTIGVSDPMIEWGRYVLVRPWDRAAFMTSLRNAEKTRAGSLDPDGNRAVMLCSTTDGYQAIRHPDPAIGKLFNEQARHIRREALKAIRDHSTLNVRILTRSPWAEEDFDLFKSFGNRLLLGTSLPTLDPVISEIYEGKAAVPNRRLKLLLDANAAGINTYVAVAPVFPECGYQGMLEVFNAVKQANPWTIFMEPVNLRIGVAQRIQSAATNLEREIDITPYTDPEAWSNYAISALRDAERAAKEAGVFDRLHLWPDHRALGSQAVLRRQSDPHAYLKWLNSYWNRISEWPGKTA